MVERRERRKESEVLSQEGSVWLVKAMQQC